MALNPPQDFRKTEFTHRSGLAAARPAASDVLVGTLYFSTDTGTIERSNGAIWSAFGGDGGGSGPMGPMGPIGYGIDGVDGEDGFIYPPGSQGLQGIQGIPGAPGSGGSGGGSTIIIQETIEEQELPYIIPGAQGAIGLQGNTGNTGLPGLQGLQGIPGIDAEEPEYPYIIPGPGGVKGATGASGGGGGSLSSTVVTLPYSRKQHSVNVVDALVTAVSKIMITLGTTLDTDVNADDLDLLSLSTVPAAGSFLVKMNFVTPTGGPITLNYMVG